MEQDKFATRPYETAGSDAEEAKERPRKKKKPAVELGRFIAAAEERATGDAPAPPAETEVATGAAHPLSVAAVGRLSRHELIEQAGLVRFGETNLRRVYEAQLVDEKGLRRLLREALAGNDLRRALAREFLVKELRFERDPRLKGGEPEAAGAGTAPADASATPRQAEASESARPAADQRPASPATVRRRARPRASRSRTAVSPAVLIGLTVFTVLLAIYAVWLTVHH